MVKYKKNCHNNINLGGGYMEDMQTILITAIGSFSADIAIKSLKKNGMKVIGCDIYPKEWIADAYNVSKFYQAPYATNEDEYMTFIKELIKNEKINYIFPSTDIEVDLLNRYRNLIEDLGVKICISPKDTIVICRDKKILYDYLKKRNISNLISTYELSEVQEEVQFPLVCKPKNGRSSQGLKYIYTKEELLNLKTNIDINNYIVQPFIQGEIITVDIVRNATTNKSVAVCRKELLRTSNGAGTSVYVFNDVELEALCKKIAESLGIVGCVNFEFIEDSNKNFHFIECNPRFSGGIEFSCLCGYDYITNHLKCFKGKEIDEKIEFKNRYIARKYEEYITKIDK